MENLQDQIRALQAGARRQKLINIALGGVIAAGALLAAARPVADGTFDSVTCKSWQVVDAGGKKRIVAAAQDDGSAGVSWFDANGKKRIAAKTADADASMGFFDKDGKSRMSAGTFDADASAIWVDKQGTARIGIGTYGDGTASVMWLDKNGKPWINGSTNADGTVVLPTKDLKKP